MSEHNITVEGGTSVRLPTAGKYCDRDIVVTAQGGGSSGGGEADNSALIGLIDGTIKDVVIPSEITKLRVGAFAYTDIISLVIPDHVTSVGSQFAYYTKSLTRVSIGKNVDFGDGVQHFGYCSALTEAIMAEGITKIPGHMFAQCTKLASLTIPSTVTHIGGNAFNSTIIENLIIPDGVTQIDGGAIYNMQSLKSVTLGSGVTTLGNNMFSLCKALKSITCLATTPPTLGSSSFGSVPTTCAIYVPAASVNAYKSATNWAARANYIQAIP